MFQSLTDFSYQRSALQAVGFYIVYLILTIILGAIAGVVFGISTSNLGSDIGQKVGMITAILVVLTLSFRIIQAKKLLNKYFYVGLAVLSAVVAFLGGGLLGLIITAYLTTLSAPKNKSKK
jgi:hypothetical protein